MKQFVFLLLTLLVPLFSNAQKLHFLTDSVKECMNICFNKKTPETKNYSTDGNTTHGLNNLFRIKEDLLNFELAIKKSLKTKQSDTLIVGDTPNDSLIITGNYSYTGTIVVWGNGILRFRNANAVINGDIYVWGETAILTIDSSYIFCPQQYFYQRSLVAAGGGIIEVNNSTLDYGGLSHSLLLTDSAYIEMNYVHNNGFTTCGLYNKAYIKIDHTNQAGEFIATENTKLYFTDANTILLWHQIPPGAAFNMDFPDNGAVTSYVLNNSTPGINNINYSINVSNCTDVMWGLMPCAGSDVNISNSQIRAIGLWFEGNDTLAVNGLVNNSNYTVFTAPIADRQLSFTNTSVQTWSLYTFDHAGIDVTGCIVGEIGAMDNSSVNTENIFVDGSGGYFFANDNTFVLSANTNTSSSIRSSGNGVFIYAYSTVSNGNAMALNNSILLVVQSMLPEDPVALDGACAWFVNLETPYSSYVDSVISLNGSAWIDKTTTSQLMDFSYYQLFYQVNGDSNWIPITPKIVQEKHHEPIASWDTHGMQPGAYLLKLVVADNFPDTNEADAIKQITLLPAFMDIQEINTDNLFTIYPNPVEGSFIFLNSGVETVEIVLTDVQGRVLKSVYANEGINNIDICNFSSGVYFVIVKQRKSNSVCKITKK